MTEPRPATSDVATPRHARPKRPPADGAGQTWLLLIAAGVIFVALLGGMTVWLIVGLRFVTPPAAPGAGAAPTGIVIAADSISWITRPLTPGDDMWTEPLAFDTGELAVQTLTGSTFELRDKTRVHVAGDSHLVLTEGELTVVAAFGVTFRVSLSDGSELNIVGGPATVKADGSGSEVNVRGGAVAWSGPLLGSGDVALKRGDAAARNPDGSLRFVPGPRAIPDPEPALRGEP